MQKTIASLAATLTTLLLIGCTTKSYDIRVTLDPSYADTLDHPVRVHVIAADDAGKRRIVNVTTVDYFGERGSPAEFVDILSGKPNETFMLSSDNPIGFISKDANFWKAVSNSNTICVISSEPKGDDLSTDGTDPRKCFFTADKLVIDADEVDVTITKQGLTVTKIHKPTDKSGG